MQEGDKSISKYVKSVSKLDNDLFRFNVLFKSDAITYKEMEVYVSVSRLNNFLFTVLCSHRTQILCHFKNIFIKAKFFGSILIR